MALTPLGERRLDDAMRIMVMKYGINDVLAALCRECNRQGRSPIFRKLNRVYEWLITTPKG